MTAAQLFYLFYQSLPGVLIGLVAYRFATRRTPSHRTDSAAALWALVTAGVLRGTLEIWFRQVERDAKRAARAARRAGLPTEGSDADLVWTFLAVGWELACMASAVILPVWLIWRIAGVISGRTTRPDS